MTRAARRRPQPPALSTCDGGARRTGVGGARSRRARPAAAEASDALRVTCKATGALTPRPGQRGPGRGGGRRRYLGHLRRKRQALRLEELQKMQDAFLAQDFVFAFEHPFVNAHVPRRVQEPARCGETRGADVCRGHVHACARTHTHTCPRAPTRRPRCTTKARLRLTTPQAFSYCAAQVTQGQDAARRGLLRKTAKVMAASMCSIKCYPRMHAGWLWIWGDANQFVCHPAYTDI